MVRVGLARTYDSGLLRVEAMALEHAFMKSTFLSPRLAEVCRTRLGSPGSACMEEAVHGGFKTSPALITEKASIAPRRSDAALNVTRR